jgi:hypothetical protein
LTDVPEMRTASIIRAMALMMEVIAYAALERPSTSTWLHGATSQKILNFIVGYSFLKVSEYGAL